MHELSLCRSLLTQVEQVARQQGASAVRRVYLQIGPLSGAEPQLMQAAFPLAAAGGIAGQAELLIEATPVSVRCHTCGQQSFARPNKLCCAGCGSDDTQLLSGTEILLVGLDLAVDEIAMDSQEQPEQSHVH